MFIAIELNHLSIPSVPQKELSSLDMQVLLEHFLICPNIKNTCVQAFLSKHNITLVQSCMLCYVDITFNLYSEKINVRNILIDKSNTFLSNTLINSNLLLIHGELNGYWVLLVIFKKAPSNPLDLLSPLIRSIEKQHFKASLYPDVLSLDNLFYAKDKCINGFERFYFDLPYAKVDPDDYAKQVSNIISSAISAMSCYDYVETIQLFSQLFALFNSSRPPISSIKKLLSDFVYALLSTKSDYIKIISESKFTNHDILYIIETSPRLSVLQRQLFETLNNYIQITLHSSTNKDEYIIRKAKEYIEANYADAISLAHVSAHVFLHPNYFSSLFKIKVGTTFRQYLRDIRIAKAKELLKDSNLKIYEIAKLVGYNEASHFIRAFKETTGENPSSYKQTL